MEVEPQQTQPKQPEPDAAVGPPAEGPAAALSRAREQQVSGGTRQFQFDRPLRFTLATAMLFLAAAGAANATAHPMCVDCWLPVPYERGTMEAMVMPCGHAVCYDCMTNLNAELDHEYGRTAAGLAADASGLADLDLHCCHLCQVLDAHGDSGLPAPPPPSSPPTQHRPVPSPPPTHPQPCRATPSPQSPTLPQRLQSPCSPLRLPPPLSAPPPSPPCAPPSPTGCPGRPQPPAPPPQLPARQPPHAPDPNQPIITPEQLPTLQRAIAAEPDLAGAADGIFASNGRWWLGAPTEGRELRPDGSDHPLPPPHPDAAGSLASGIYLQI